MCCGDIVRGAKHVLGVLRTLAHAMSVYLRQIQCIQERGQITCCAYRQPTDQHGTSLPQLSIKNLASWLRPVRRWDHINIYPICRSH